MITDSDQVSGISKQLSGFYGGHLPGHQQALLEAVHTTGTPVVVVLMSGRPLTIP